MDLLLQLIFFFVVLIVAPVLVMMSRREPDDQHHGSIGLYGADEKGYMDMPFMYQSMRRNHQPSAALRAIALLLFAFVGALVGTLAALMIFNMRA